MNHFGKNVLTTAGTTLFSRLLGFARDASMAWILGTGPVADALSAALRLPWAMRRLLGEGSLSLGLSVACTAHTTPCALALAVGKRLFRPAVLSLILLVLAAPVLVDLLAPGAPDSLRREAAFLLRLTLPYVLFAAGAACCMAGLHAAGRFALPGLMPAVFNVLILGFAGVAVLTGAGAFTAACLLAAGVGFGGLVQWLVLLYAAKRDCAKQDCRPSAVPGPAPCADTVREALRRLPAGIFGAAVPQLCFVLAGGVASWQGDMAALFYAERLLEFPLGVLGAAVGMAAVPELRHDPGAVTARVLEWTLALHVAAGAGLMAVSQPLVNLLYGHGAFDIAAVTRTASCLSVYALALPAYAASRPLLAACQLHGLSTASNAAAWAGLVTCGLTGSLFLLAHAELPETFGPALSVVLGLSVQAVWLWTVQYRRMGLRLPWRVALNIPAGCVVYFSAATLLETVPGVLGLGLSIGGGVLGWGIFWGLAALLGVLPPRSANSNPDA